MIEISMLTRYFPSIVGQRKFRHFFYNYRRYFADISVFLPIFSEISVTVHESVLFTTVHKMEKFVAEGVRTLAKSAGF